MKQFKSLKKFETYIKKTKPRGINWHLWDFDGVPWERGFCRFDQIVSILLRNPENGFYFIFTIPFPAYYYDWSSDAGDFKIYAFLPRGMKNV